MKNRKTQMKILCSCPLFSRAFLFFSWCSATTKRTNRKRTATMKIEWKTELENRKHGEFPEKSEATTTSSWKILSRVMNRKFSYREMCSVCVYTRCFDVTALTHQML
jgi:hypothetical protein